MKTETRKEFERLKRKFRRQLEEVKLKELLDDYGMDDMEFMREYGFSSLVPAICMQPDCNATYEYEVDQNKGYCENCDSNSVTSGLILMGMV